MFYSKEMTAFSDFPIPENYPEFLSHENVINYLSAYVDEFKLFAFIRFNVDIVQIWRSENWNLNGLWNLEYSISSENNLREKKLSKI